MVLYDISERETEREIKCGEKSFSSFVCSYQDYKC